MSTVIISNPQNRVKDTYASSPSIGLTVRANGEEQTTIIDKNGNVLQAGIPAPTALPTVADGGSGNLTNAQYVSYIYVYAATKNYPYVDSTLGINGSLAPRSNQSPSSAAYHITGSGNRKLTITVTKTTRSDINQIWIFRTDYFASAIEAKTAADAGEAFYIGEVANTGGAGTITYSDNAALTGIDQVELDNFVAPTFQFVVFFDPYWWGFGNFPFQASATWATSGIVTITNPDKWFTGRNGQNISLAGVTTGGFDGQGTFAFLWISNTTAQLTLDGTHATDQTLSSTGSGLVTIQGVATTLYRSKPRNPLAWGYTQQIGTSLVPIEYAYQVGGGYGTALAVVPNVSLLKLDCEEPTVCYTLNLRLAGTSSFEQSLRAISNAYSVSSHWSQFPASTQQGLSVLWGIDYKNFAILQSNGITQTPISGPIPRILRRLTTTKSRQLLCHGVYDPRTELNCLWVTTQNSLSLVNYLIYQHAPTGFWGFVNEQDILASASIYDTLTGTQKTFVGTQSGFVGQAFADGIFNNWLPTSGTYTGTASAGSANTISINTGAFNTTDDGMVGNWCLVTDALGQNEQWARISAVATLQLTFDLILPAIGGVTNTFLPLPSAGSLFYVGLIQCSLRKDFDLDQPTLDKKISSYYLTQINSDDKTLVRFYREKFEQYIKQFNVKQTTYDDNSLSFLWQTLNQAPQLRAKAFGIEAINRGYSDFQFINFVFETNVTA